MLWAVAIKFTKYTVLTYAILCISFVGWLYFRTKDWRYAFSVLVREESQDYKGLQQRQVLMLKTIRLFRLSAGTGACILLILMTLQLALDSNLR